MSYAPQTVRTQSLVVLVQGQFAHAYDRQTLVVHRLVLAKRQRCTVHTLTCPHRPPVPHKPSDYGPTQQFLSATKASSYDASSITVLEGLEAVRRRPGMYIGSTGQRGLTHLLFEVVDNAVDEALAGQCDTIHVEFLPNHTFAVTDNGRGIPCEVHPATGKSALETVLCVLHAGGKFGNEQQGGYSISSGLHGVGVSVVNALSERLTVEVVRDGKHSSMHFSRGVPVSDLQQRNALANETRGTRVIFQPDAQIFSETLRMDEDNIQRRLDELAYLNPSLRIELRDNRLTHVQDENDKERRNEKVKSSIRTTTKMSGEKDAITEETASQSLVYQHRGGLSELVTSQSADRPSLFSQRDVITIQEVVQGIKVDIALRWCKDSYSESMSSFANSVRTIDGGMHVDGLRSAITKTVNVYARKLNKLKEKDAAIAGEYIREGLFAVVSVQLREAEFEGQTKTRLGNTVARSAVEDAVTRALTSLFDWHPEIVTDIVAKALRAQSAAIAARAARDIVRRKSLLSNTVLPGKLADCSLSRGEGPPTEIFVVEGDSAAGSAKLGRDRTFQAILPLRGKILNVEKATTDKIYQNQELQALISALGLGAYKAEYSPTSLRYDRIVLMTDADVDGAHIRLLLLTFLYRYQPALLLDNRVFIACPPLYKLSLRLQRETNGSKSRGQSVEVEQYFHEQEAFDEVMTSVNQGHFGPEQSRVLSHSIQRFKGLGEMMPQQLWETTMNPACRSLKQVRVNDAQRAAQFFATCMGDDIGGRKQLIDQCAQQMQRSDLDI